MNLEGYRYTLNRSWEEGSGRVCWVMLNPSTADDDKDDHTIRKCVGFSKRWGFQSLEVVNLFPLRATKPKVLHAATVDERIGPYPRWDRPIAIAAHLSQCVVMAWGNHGARYPERVTHIRTIVGRAPAMVRDLGPITKLGQPRHPLTLGYAAGVLLGEE